MTFLLKYLHPMKLFNPSLVFSFLLLAVSLLWVAGWVYAQELETSTSIVNAQDKLRNDLVSLEEEIKRLQR